VVEEGAGEWFNKWIAKSFYKALGGFDLYTNFDLLQTPRYLRPLALRYPQMFLLQYMRGEYTVTMLERYNQYDLTETGAAIMDAHYALFVWSGKACSASLRVTAIRIAKRFSKYITLLLHLLHSTNIWNHFSGVASQGLPETRQTGCGG
jgi:hypothetical protein